MTKNEAAKLETAKDVVAVIEEQDSQVISSTVAAVLTKKDELKTVIEEINSYEDKLKNSATGLTSAKTEVEEDLIDDTLEIAGGIYGYADTIEDVELKEFADLNERDFDRLKNADVPVKIKSVLDKADGLVANLVDYGITQDILSDARDKLTLLNTKTDKQGTGFSGKSAARDLLYDKFAKIDSILVVLDKLMKKFKKLNPVFYYKYASARIIKNKAVRHKAEETTPPPAPPQS
jgi:hypothetical protein